MRISFRYNATKITTTTEKAYSGVAGNQYEFEAVSLSPAIPNIRKISGENLNLSSFCHILGSKKERDITISADELDETNCAFFNNWFEAQYAYISIYNGTSWSDYIRVTTEQGRVPFTFIDGIITLPELTFTIFYWSKND
jgi:hypothetical protein